MYDTNVPAGDALMYVPVDYKGIFKLCADHNCAAAVCVGKETSKTRAARSLRSKTCLIGRGGIFLGVIEK